MKTLTNLQIKVDGDKVTITGIIVEKQFQLPLSQQVTIGHAADDNPNWGTHIQISPEALFVKTPPSRAGSGVALPTEDWRTICLSIEPKLTYPPIFSKQPTSDSLDVEINSELKPLIQWQESDDGKTWSDVSITAPISGKFYRCIAKTDAGSTTSKEIQFK